MDLNAIAAAATASITPSVSATLQTSAGYTTNADGSRSPAYSAPITVTAQVQPMTYRDLVQVEGLNLNGTQRAVYLHGDVNGVVRVAKDGGDLITIPTGPNSGVYLVVHVLEAWPDWVKVVATLQDGS